MVPCHPDIFFAEPSKENLDYAFVHLGIKWRVFVDLLACQVGSTLANDPWLVDEGPIFGTQDELFKRAFPATGNSQVVQANLSKKSAPRSRYRMRNQIYLISIISLWVSLVIADDCDL
jgi:hypothetical protein